MTTVARVNMTKTAQPKARKANASIIAAGELVDRLTAAFRAHAEGYVFPDGSVAEARGFRQRAALIRDMPDDERRVLDAVCASLGLVASRSTPRTKGITERV